MARESIGSGRNRGETMRNSTPEKNGLHPPGDSRGEEKGGERGDSGDQRDGKDVQDVKDKRDQRDRIDKDGKRILRSVFGIGAGLLILFSVFAVLSVFGGAIMHLFGFEYRSVGSAVLFFVLAALAGFPAEIAAKALPKALLSLGRLSVRRAKGLFLLLDMAVTMISMAVIDAFMDSVTTTFLSVFVIALILAVFSVSEIGDKEER